MYPLPEEVDFFPLPVKDNLDAPEGFWLEVLDSQITINNKSQRRKLA